MENSESLLNITVIWRGNKYVLGINPDASLKNLGDELQKLTDFKPVALRLIVPQISSKGSKLFSPFSKEYSELSLRRASIVEGKAIRMMGVSKYEVDKVLQNAEDNLRIARFDEEERRMRLRMSARPNSLLKLPQGPYIFCDFHTLQLPGIELNPPASEALKRMHMLAAEPGIVAIINKNHGEEISLRLRTDDLKGFRKYENITKTLLHELAHMVFSEHDANFCALDKQLNQEAVSLDWTKSRGHSLGGVRHLDYYEEDYDALDNRSLSQKLGGSASNKLASAHASSVAAANCCLADASADVSKVSGVLEEPDPDDSRSSMHGRPGTMDNVREENKDDESSLKVLLKHSCEPDPDEHSCDQNKYEPDPDDSQSNHHQVMSLLNGGIQFSNTINEPDPDDLEAKQINLIDRNVHQTDHNNFLVTERMDDQSSKAYKEPDRDESQTKRVLQAEPDPDDDLMASKEISCLKIDERLAIDEPDVDHSEAKQSDSGNGNICKPDQNNSLLNESMEDPACSNKDYKEPNPDESHANRVARMEPDPDDDLGGSEKTSNMMIDEPDPDDQELHRIRDPVTVVCNKLQKAVETLRTEINLTEASAALQTLLKIIRNVIELPNETKFKKLRKANPIIQKNVANYKVAMEILQVVGFI